MSNIEKAKQLIKKGLELKDNELIQLGYDLLKEEKSAPVTKNPQKQLTKPVAEETLEEVDVNLEIQPEDSGDGLISQFRMQTRGNTSSVRQRSVIDRDGNEKDVTFTRPEKVDLNRLKFNTFDDDGVEEKDKDKFRGKDGQLHDMSELYRPPVVRDRPGGIVISTCVICGKKEKVGRTLLNTFANGYKCMRCIKRGHAG